MLEVRLQIYDQREGEIFEYDKSFVDAFEMLDFEKKLEGDQKILLKERIYE